MNLWLLSLHLLQLLCSDCAVSARWQGPLIAVLLQLENILQLLGPRLVNDEHLWLLLLLQQLACWLLDGRNLHKGTIWQCLVRDVLGLGRLLHEYYLGRLHWLRLHQLMLLRRWQPQWRLQGLLYSQLRLLCLCCCEARTAGADYTP